MESRSAAWRQRFRLRGYLIPWPYRFGYGVRGEGTCYRAWRWRGLLVSHAKLVKA